STTVLPSQEPGLPHGSLLPGAFRERVHATKLPGEPALAVPFVIERQQTIQKRRPHCCWHSPPKALPRLHEITLSVQITPPVGSEDSLIELRLNVPDGVDI